MRKAISEMIESDPALTVIGTADDGLDAIEKVKSLKPDFVTLDIEMPRMDGIGALRVIMRQCPTRVLMCSVLTTDGSREALLAMQIGACDFITKDAGADSGTSNLMRDELVAKIRAIGGVDTGGRLGRAERGARSEPPRAAAPSPIGPQSPAKKRVSGKIPAYWPGQFDLVVVGSSTGGPPVLETILTGLPADLSVPIVIAQHMPRLFTKSMSERLDSLTSLTVVHGESGMPLYAGTVYVGVGGLQVRIVKSSTGRMALEISDQPAEALYKPSVNELFASASRAAGSRCLGVMCTGMGDDGVIGSKPLKQAGGTLIAQSEATCVVYGMPRAVVDAGLADSALAPEQIAQALRRLSPSSAERGEKHGRLA